MRRLVSNDRRGDRWSLMFEPPGVLEFSTIAWPNAKMWSQAQAQVVHAASVPGMRYELKNEEDAHAHSPNRRTGSRGSGRANATVPTTSQWQAKGMASATMPWTSSLQPNLESMADPFVDLNYLPESSRQPRGAQTSSIDDVSMPDYRSQSNSDSSRAISHMTGISYEQKANSMAGDVDDAAIAELVEALSPLKGSQGTQAPSNTPSGDQTLPIVSRPSAAAEARSASYSSVKSKKEGRDKENVSSSKSSRLPSQASQSRLDLVAGIDEPLSEGKRKRSAAETPEGRKSSPHSVSPSVAKAVAGTEGTNSPKIDQSGSNSLQVPAQNVKVENE